jgi:predicted amidophosphoribosyltransferase
MILADWILCLERAVLGAVRAGVRLAGVLAAPSQCPSCRRRIARRAALCRPCARSLGAMRTLRTRVGMEIAPGRLRQLRVSSLGPLRGTWGRLVRAYKEDPAPQVADLITPALERAVRREARACPRREEAPVLVPIPMAGVRRRQRGINPPERLALALARRLGWDCAPDAVRRVRYTRPLRGLSARRRREEVSEAFAPGPGMPALSGRAVLLLDDVLTTGATLIAAARPLLEAGVCVEGAWTLGRTPRRKRGRGASQPSGTMHVSRNRHQRRSE